MPRRKEVDSTQKYLDLAGVMILALDLDQKVTLINQKGCELLGYSREEILGKNWFDHFIPCRLREQCREGFQRLVGGEAEPLGFYENPVLTRRGEERLIAFRHALLRDEGGAVTGILSSGEDITGRRRAEHRLKTQYAVAEVLVKSTHLGEAFPQLLKSVCQAEGWQVGELWEPEGEGQHLRRTYAWHDPSLEGSRFALESDRFTFKPGEGLPGHIWFSEKPEILHDLTRKSTFRRAFLVDEPQLRVASGFPVRHQGKVVAVTTFLSREIPADDSGTREVLAALQQQIEDFIERRQGEETLRRSEARLRAVLDTVADGIITIDDRGIIESFNPAAERIFGYRAEEVLGRNVGILMPSPDRERHDQYLARYLQTGRARIIGIGREVLGRRKDGTTFPIYLSIGEMKLGQRRMFTGIIRDFTDFKRMQEEVIQARHLAAIGEMTASVAHEIKNPIAGIAGAIQVIRDQMSPEDPLRRVIDEIFQQVRRLDNTVRHLLMFARPWQAEKQMCDLKELVCQITAASKRRDQFMLIEFSFSNDARPRVPVDPALFEHLLENLLSNSAHAMPDGGTINFSFKEDSESVHMTVADRGTGIPPEAMQHLFRPFFTTKTRGTGLGLSICKKIMDAHGGTIRVFSRPGEGTEVVLQFPKF